MSLIKRQKLSRVIHPGIHCRMVQAPTNRNESPISREMPRVCTRQPMAVYQMLDEREMRILVIAFPERNKARVEHQFHQQTEPENASQREVRSVFPEASNHNSGRNRT